MVPRSPAGQGRCGRRLRGRPASGLGLIAVAGGLAQYGHRSQVFAVAAWRSGGAAAKHVAGSRATGVQRYASGFGKDIEKRKDGGKIEKSKGKERKGVEEPETLWDAVKPKTPRQKREEELARRPRTAKGELSTTRLNELRDKAITQRIKREREIDDYERGRAMLAKYGPAVGVMPKKVADRVAARGAVGGGSVYSIMVGVFIFAGWLYKTQNLIIPPGMLAIGTLVLLFLAIGASSYGLMSASWDEDREGSALGWEEFQKNAGYIGDGFRKASLQPEYEKAIDQRREKRKKLAAVQEAKGVITDGS